MHISFKGRDMKNKQHGITLIEIVVLIAYIGILVALAKPMYLDYTVRNQVAEGLDVAAGTKSALTEYYEVHGILPTDNADAGLEAAGNIQSKYVASVSVAGALITIQYGNDANVQINGETVTLTAFDKAGNVAWACAGGGVIQDKHLPPACR